MSNNIFLKLYRLWDNKVKYRRAGQATDDNMKHAHWILDTLGYTHLEYVIFITSPLQQCLHERVSVLRYTQIACLGVTRKCCGKTLRDQMEWINYAEASIKHYECVPVFAP